VLDGEKGPRKKEERGGGEPADKNQAVLNWSRKRKTKKIGKRLANEALGKTIRGRENEALAAAWKEEGGRRLEAASSLGRTC